jgi:adenylate cyclase
VPPEVTYEQAGQRHTYVLDKDEISIGRAPENDLVIQDGSISRFHAKIHREGGHWHITDLGSKNGTHVNDVSSPVSNLKDGDEILLGKLPMSFRDQAAGVALTAPPSGTMVDDVSGTIFRHAVDFSSLANKPQQSARSPQMDADRLRKLLSIVTEVSQALLAALPLDQTLQKVLDLVFQQLPVERGCVLLWDEKRMELVPKVSRSRDAKAAGEINISRTIAEKVFREKVAVLTTDAQHDPRFAGGASILALGIRSAMAAPLWRGDRVEGLIYVDTPLHVKAFDDFDLDLLSALGNHAAVAIEQSRLQESILEERLSRQKLERYHSPAVVERITHGGGELEMLEADEREVTVVFADAVGFTDRCERTEPREVAQLLNRYFSRMADMIFRHEGTLDKFIGDCLMAVFGAPFPLDDHENRAVESAIDMRDALRELNMELAEDQRLQFRVGMHSGRVVAGDIGSAKRSDYTVLGATVNLAARLQGSVAEPGQIIISDATAEALRDRFILREVGEFQPKGISRPVKCFEVMDRRPA